MGVFVVIGCNGGGGNVVVCYVGLIVIIIIDNGFGFVRCVFYYWVGVWLMVVVGICWFCGGNDFSGFCDFCCVFCVVCIFSCFCIVFWGSG